ncbi:MAG: PaaI family thioesterase [Tepidiformaceae bacterium]
MGTDSGMDERRSRWLPDEEPPEGQRAASHRLAAALRRTIHLLMESDPPEADLLAAAEAAERFAERLAEAPRGHTLWGFAETSNAGDTHSMFDNSPLIGLSNPISPPLMLWVERDGVVGTATFGAAYEGPPGHVHGGITAAAFDELLGMVQSMTGSPGMTGTLTVRYRRPAPLHRELRFAGRVDRVDGRKIFASGTLHDGETLCAEAEGIFVSVDFERLRQMASVESG